MIETLQLTNFKRHADTTLRLSPFTLLVGPNGAGKTSVLEALHLLSLLEQPNGIAPRRGFSMAATARSRASDCGSSHRPRGVVQTVQ